MGGPEYTFRQTIEVDRMTVLPDDTSLVISFASKQDQNVIGMFGWQKTNGVINTESQFFLVRDEVRNISSIGHAAVSTRAELATLYQTVMTAASTGRRLEEVFPHGREASVVTIAVAIGCAVVGGGISGGSLAVGAAIFCMTILEPTSLHRRELKENARKLSAASVNSYMTDNGLELLKDSWCVGEYTN